MPRSIAPEWNLPGLRGLPRTQVRNMEATSPGSSPSPVAFHRSDRPLMSVMPSPLLAARVAPFSPASVTVSEGSGSEAVGRPELLGLQLLQFQNSDQATLS